MVAVRQSADCLHQSWIIEADPGNVDRHRRRLFPLGNPSCKQLTGLLPDVVIQLGNESIALKDRNKFSRRDHAAFRLCPPHQHFRSTDPVVLQAVLRLQVKDEFLLVQRMPHMVDNLLFPHDVFPHLIHIERIVFDVIAFALLGSQIRPVIHRINGEIPLPDHIDSDCRHHIKSELVLSKTHAHVAHKL